MAARVASSLGLTEMFGASYGSKAWRELLPQYSKLRNKVVQMVGGAHRQPRAAPEAVQRLHGHLEDEAPEAPANRLRVAFAVASQRTVSQRHRQLGITAHGARQGFEREASVRKGARSTTELSPELDRRTTIIINVQGERPAGC